MRRLVDPGSLRWAEKPSSLRGTDMGVGKSTGCLGFSLLGNADAPLRLCASKQKQQQTRVFGGSSNRSTESNTEWWQPTR